MGVILILYTKKESLIFEHMFLQSQDVYEIFLLSFLIKINGFG